MSQVRIEIAAHDLSLLSQLGLKLALSRATRDQSPATVLWQVLGLAPSQTASWGTDFGFYASLAPPTVGSAVTPNSTLASALVDRIYSLDPNLVFQGPQSGGGAGAGTYAVDNGYTVSEPIGLGLLQSAEVNGQSVPTAPLVAQASADPFRSTFEPLDLAYLSLRSDAVAGLVINPAAAPNLVSFAGGGPDSAQAVEGPLTRLDFATLGPSLVAAYDPTTGGFDVAAAAP